MGQRVEEEGASEGRSVIERIGIASLAKRGGTLWRVFLPLGLWDKIIPPCKRADFPLVFRHERTLAN